MKPYFSLIGNYPPVAKIITKNIFLTILVLIVILFSIGCKRDTPPAIDQEHKIQTPLDSYVHSPDPDFHYQVMHQSKEKGYTFYVLKMISQEWLSEELVDEPVWWHWVNIVVPDSVSHKTAFLWVGGGARDDEMPTAANAMLTRSALLTHSVTAEIHNIPNQTIHFKDDTVDERYEDALIAYGWRQFLEAGARDEEAVWLARLPMTKAVVKAMDAIGDFIAEERNIGIEKFAIAGASKRGWTTWTTAAVDDRVVAIVPVVIDLLNIVPSFEHHWKNYGFWAPAIHDYEEEGIMDWMGSKEFDRLLAITEPYSYLDRYDMPKLLINAAGDQFFQPDSWKFYWKDLKGAKYLRYVPDTGHSLRGTDALETMIAFYDAIIDQRALPEYRWEFDGYILRVDTDPENPPAEVKLWYAVNEDARDFRIEVIGKEWKDSTLVINPAGKYAIPLKIPAVGWKAYFVELTYDYDLPLKLTSGIAVLPEIYPFEAFESSGPRGTFDE